MQSTLPRTSAAGPTRKHILNIKTRKPWRDTFNGVSRQFYSPLASCIATQSDIRLTPSGIRYASFVANKISLKP